MRAAIQSPKFSFQLLAVLLAFLTASVSLTVIAEEKTETVTTLGVAMDGQPGSRREALDDAMRNAVEEAMGSMVSVDLIVENKAIVNEKILSQTRGYISSYDILSEEQDGGLYRVKLRAEVRLGKVRDDLEAAGLLMRRKQMPRVMVMTMQKTDPQAVTPGKQYVDSVRNIVEEEFLAGKFSLVDINQHISQQNLAQAIGNHDKLVALARDSGAELLVLTDATRYFERNVSLYGSNYQIFRSEVQLRVIETGTGKVIYSGNGEGEPSAAMDPVYDTARQLAHTGIEAILQKWASDVSNATSYKLSINNINFKTLQNIEQAIRNLPGVDVLYRRAFDAGQGRFDIEYRGSADELVRLLGKLQSPALEIVGMSQQTIDAVAR
jgi:hypothetical protein